MGYTPHQAYPNHLLHYLAFNPYESSSFKPKSPQPMVPILDQVQSVSNCLLDHSKGDPNQGSSLKQPHFDPILTSYTELLPILV